MHRTTRPPWKLEAQHSLNEGTHTSHHGDDGWFSGQLPHPQALSTRGTQTLGSDSEASSRAGLRDRDP